MDDEESPTKKAKGKGGKAKKAATEEKVDDGDAGETIIKDEEVEAEDAP